MQVFFTTKTESGIKVTDDMNRNYGVFKTMEEAKEKINKLNEVF